MNIFHLHTDPKICAEYHCDKHVVKMILETAQMLSTAYRKKFNDGEELYKTAFPKHHMTIWVGASGDNFFWTIKLLDQLLYQYTLRYKKVHTTIRISNLFEYFSFMILLVIGSTSSTKEILSIRIILFDSKFEILFTFFFDPILT